MLEPCALPPARALLESIPPTRRWLRRPQDISYRAEEAVAFVLSYVKQIAEKEAGSSVKDCVITAREQETRNGRMDASCRIMGRPIGVAGLERRGLLTTGRG